MTTKTKIDPKEKQMASVDKKTVAEEITNNKSDVQGPHSLLHSMETSKKTTSTKKKTKKSINAPVVFFSALVIVLAGSITGFGLSKAFGSSSGAPEVTGVTAGTGKIADGEVKVGDVLGNADKDGDEAEGVLEKGGINGEGSHKLLRAGGPSQTVYLTSSVIDLDQLVGHKVKVWGDTFAAQSAGWLMDVVTVEVVDLDAPKPFEDE